MAIASVGSIGTASVATSSATWVITLATAQLDAGNIGIIIIATDNTRTTDGDGNEHRTLTDSVGNIWVKLREFTNGQAAAAAGATVSVWMTKATTNHATTDTFTLTLATARTAKAATGWEYTVGSGNTLVLDDAKDLASDAVTAWGSIAGNTLSSLERLWVRATAQEWNVNTTWTVSASFTKITAVSSTGSTAAAMGAMGEFRIATATTLTSNPTGTIAAACDLASTMVALREVTQALGKDEDTPVTPWVAPVAGRTALAALALIGSLGRTEDFIGGGAPPPPALDSGIEWVLPRQWVLPRAPLVWTYNDEVATRPALPYGNSQPWAVVFGAAPDVPITLWWQNDEVVPATAVALDDQGWAPPRPWGSVPPARLFAADEDAVTPVTPSVVEGDDWVPPGPWRTATPPPVAADDADYVYPSTTPAVAGEDGWSLSPPWRAAPPTPLFSEGDELPTASAPSVVDDDAWVAPIPWGAVRPVAPFADDADYVYPSTTPAIAGEAEWPLNGFQQVWHWTLFADDTDAPTLFGVPSDEAGWAAPVRWLVLAPAVFRGAEDDFAPSTPPSFEFGGSQPWAVVFGAAPEAPVTVWWQNDEVSVSSTPAISEVETWAAPLPWAIRPPRPWFDATDEVPSGAVASIADDDRGYTARAVVWPTGPASAVFSLLALSLAGDGDAPLTSAPLVVSGVLRQGILLWGAGAPYT